MVTVTILGDLLAKFNSFFEGSAEATINNNRLEITIGSQTMLIVLPEVVGVQAKGSS